MKVQMIQ
eukprot:symbB.v1.2.037872.t1/scaffold5718.1/size24269/1